MKPKALSSALKKKGLKPDSSPSALAKDLSSIEQTFRVQGALYCLH